MTQGLRELQRHELIDELEKCVVPAIAAQLRSRLDGHCMRVSDLDVDLAVRICERLRSNVPGANVVILTDGTLAGVPAGMAVSSTKLVELRNPMSDGSQRPPLLVFIPAGLRSRGRLVWCRHLRGAAVARRVRRASGAVCPGSADRDSWFVGRGPESAWRGPTLAICR